MVLRRFGHKGQFVAYPSTWQARMSHTGQRRFDTYCDLIIGVCACGERHEGDEEWIQDYLTHHNCVIETHAEWVERQRAERGTCDNAI
jgi:hypothetical protein